MTWIKICATTSLRDAQASVAAGANAVGFIFAPSMRRIEINAAAEIIASLPDGVEKIGVFVNATPDCVAEIAQKVGTTGVQLHGDEAASSLPEYRQVLGNRRLIKTLQARELLADAGGQRLHAYLDDTASLDAILLDSGRADKPGGTGAPFDWNATLPIVQRIKEVLPIIIAGGLTANNVGDAIQLFEPWGVDVVSGVEHEPGKKDELKLRSFVAAVQSSYFAAGH